MLIEIHLTSELQKSVRIQCYPGLQIYNKCTLSKLFLFRKYSFFTQPADFPNKKIKCFGDVEGVLFFWGVGLALQEMHVLS